MCLLCIELTKNRVSVPDFIRNFDEVIMTDPEHAEEIKKTFPLFPGVKIFDEEVLSEEHDLLGFAD